MFSQYRSASEPQYIEASTIAANSTPNPIMRIGLWPRSIRPIFLSQPNVVSRETHRSLDRKACPDLQFNASGAGGKNCCSVSNPERPGWHSRFVTVKGRQCRSLISRDWELATAPQLVSSDCDFLPHIGPTLGPVSTLRAGRARWSWRAKSH